MNILITRPLIDSEDLMGKLFSLGHKIIHIPTLKISAVNTTPVDAKKYDAFIFTSANAIRNLKLNNQDNSKICFCGDATQSDLTKTNDRNGIVDFMNILRKMVSFDIIEFDVNDIVRSGLVKEYIVAKLQSGM